MMLDETVPSDLNVTVDTGSMLCIPDWVNAENPPEFRKFVEKDRRNGISHWELGRFIDIMSM